MKKSYIVLTVLAMAALVSCQENEINYKPLEKGEVGFYLKGARTTKAGDVATVKGVTLPLGNDGRGNSFVLEQTITDLDAMGPETKGTPAYTENVIDLYGGKFTATVIGKNGTYEEKGEFVYDSAYKKFIRKYDNDLWDNAALTFYMWMPGALDASVNSGNGIAVSNLSGGKITFSYDGSGLLAASADSVLAKDMTDLLFTSRSFSGKGTGNGQYNEKEGADVLFHHVFTGVKFASSNPAEDDATIKINEVIFRGLQDKGTCVVTPAAEGGSYSDDPTNYSSASTSVWTPASSPVSGTSYSTGAISGFADYSKSTYTFPDSFTAKGKDGKSTGDRNFNDDNASQTLWIMPQTIGSDVKLTIKYTITRDGVEEPGEWTIDFGDYLSKTGTQIELKAGQLHTFYIKIDDVNVMIEDEVDATDEEKNNVVITNTGSVDAFIRAAIIGQWLDEEGNPVFGFQDGLTDYFEVDSWYDDQFGEGVDKTETIHHGSFSDLAGYSDKIHGTTYANPLNGWLLCDDGFYYYTEVVEAGKDAGGSLFTSYKVNPDFPRNVDTGVTNHEIYFQLEISTQAVSAKMTAEKEGKSNYTWDAAWERALGYKPVKK